MRPQPDDYPEHIENAVRSLLRDGLDAGAAALQPIAYPPRDIRRERRVDRSMMVKIMKRDHFLCRYCGGKTILTPVMELLGGLYPEIFPFLSAGWKAGVTHPAIISRSPAVDHVIPVVHGGDNTEDNLVTACTPCNTIKSDFALEILGWSLRPVEDSDWDGLMSFYAHLWGVAEKPKPQYHQSWMKALGLDQ
jgi:hypothetical protein